MAYNTCWSYDNLFFRYFKLTCNKLTHFISLFYSVCVACVCIFGICNYCNCFISAFFQICFCYKNRRTLYFVLGVNCRRIAYYITRKKAYIIFVLYIWVKAFYIWFFYSAVCAACFIPFCCTYSAVNIFHNFVILLY